MKRLDGNGDETGDSAKYSYGGKELDGGTNLYYFNARYYDATIGRFINVDPVQDGGNWYVYCGNNPLKFVDPNGCFPFFVFSGTTYAPTATLGQLGQMSSLSRALWGGLINTLGPRPFMIAVPNDLDLPNLSSDDFNEDAHPAPPDESQWTAETLDPENDWHRRKVAEEIENSLRGDSISENAGPLDFLEKTIKKIKQWLDKNKRNKQNQKKDKDNENKGKNNGNNGDNKNSNGSSFPYDIDGDGIIDLS